MAIKRAISVNNLLSMTFKEMEFEDIWKASFGIPEMSGVWMFHGNSGNGKTHFFLELAKYLTNFGRVAYNTLEEGTRKSFQMAAKKVGIKECGNRLVLLNREPLEELKERLRKRKSQDIIIIDSIQYTGMIRSQYIALKEEFPKKLFIFVSHAKGKSPKGSIAEFVHYDADIKGLIEGFKVFPKSRFGGNAEFVIWEEGAKKYYNEI